MRGTFIILLSLLLLSCESSSFDKDRRQIAAKDEIRARIPFAAKDFDVTGFREDTLAQWTDTMIKRPIEYTLNFVYRDSTGRLLQNTGHVFFTPDGKSILQSQITNQDQ